MKVDGSEVRTRLSGSDGAEAQERTAALAERFDFRALHVDLAINAHKQLNGFDLRIIGNCRAAAVSEFIRQIIDGMPQYFKSPSGNRVDGTSPIGARRQRLKNGSPRR